MRGVSPVPREGVGNLPPAAARRLYPTLRCQWKCGKEIKIHNSTKKEAHNTVIITKKAPGYQMSPGASGISEKLSRKWISILTRT